MRNRLETADGTLVAQSAVACCYSKSDKYWIKDPSGIAWEAFHTLSSIPVYGDESQQSQIDAACCIPVAGESDHKAICCVQQRNDGACC